MMLRRSCILATARTASSSSLRQYQGSFGSISSITRRQASTSTTTSSGADHAQIAQIARNSAGQSRNLHAGRPLAESAAAMPADGAWGAASLPYSSIADPYEVLGKGLSEASHGDEIKAKAQDLFERYSQDYSNPGAAEPGYAASEAAKKLAQVQAAYETVYPQSEELSMVALAAKGVLVSSVLLGGTALVAASVE